MNIGHLPWFWALEQKNGSVWTSSKGCRLREEPSVRQRGREVSIRLPFDDDTAVDEVVANGEVHHLNIEVVALSREIEYRSVSF